MKTRIPYFLLLLPLFSLSQENQHGDAYNYARKIIDTLAAPGMHGRGYVSGGDSIAAKYIAARFAEFGLKSFEKIDDKHPKGNYYQRFEMWVNTFPKTEISINGKKLMPGKDFIIDPLSYSIKKNYKKVLYTGYPISKTVDSLGQDCKLGKTVIIMDSLPKRDWAFSFMNQSDCPPFVFVTRSKLTWDVSTYYSNEHMASADILKSSLPGKINSIKINIESHVVGHKTQNLIAYLPGTQYPDSFIVFTAHYDHLGVMGHDENGKEVYFPGANDNASGCAMLLNLAKYYSQHPQKYSIAFMAFAGEEAGLLGSKYYTEHPLFPLKQIKFLVNFDIMGTGDEGIKVVNATEFKTEFKTLQVLNAQNSYLKDVSPRGKTQNSDHYFFYANGVKCFFIYTLGGIKAYHDIYDRSETLPLTKFEDVFKLMLDFTGWLQAN